VPRFQTTFKRALAALFVGMLLCSLILVLVVVASAALGRSGNVDWAWVVQELSGLALPGSAIVAGICLVGAVLWLPFHAGGWRHWSLAALVGGVLFFLAWFLPHTDWLHMPLSGYDIDNYGWREAAAASALVGAIGVLIAGAMWRTAYRSAPPS
jgi:hypothetical protein